MGGMMGGMGGAAGGDDSQTVKCPQGLVGKIIGRGGETIKELMAKSGCRIQIVQDGVPDGVPRDVIISGSPDQVQMGVSLVNNIISSDQLAGPGGAAGGAFESVDCPPDLVGKVIGRGGETIRDMQQRSGAFVKIDQTMAPGLPRKVNISGTPDQIAVAKTILESILTDTGPQAIGIMAPGGATKQIPIDASLVGRLIGPKGAVIRDIQEKTGAKVQIDQNVPQGAPKQVLGEVR